MREPVLSVELKVGGTGLGAPLAVDGKYAYHVLADVMDDNIKFEHFIKNTKQGRTYRIDYSPYSKLTDTQFIDVIFQLRQCEAYEELEVYYNQECEYDCV